MSDDNQGKIVRLERLINEYQSAETRQKETIRNLRRENNNLKSELRRSKARHIGDTAAAAAALPSEREAVIAYYERIIAETEESVVRSYVHPKLMEPSLPGTYRYGITLSFPKPDEVEPDGHVPIDTWKAVAEHTGDRAGAERWAKTNVAITASRLPMPKDFSGRRYTEQAGVGAAESILANLDEDEKLALFHHLRPFYDLGRDEFNAEFGNLFNQLLPRLDLTSYAEHEARDMLHKFFKRSFKNITKNREHEAWEWDEM